MNAPVAPSSARLRVRPFRTVSAESGDTADQLDSQRWVVSYADFVTLLFAFFVVMYSISSVNDGKFRVFSESMVTALEQPPQLPAPIDLGGGMPGRDRLGDAAISAAPLVEGLLADEDGSLSSPIDPLGTDGKDELSTVEHILAGPISGGHVHLRQSADWTEIELDSGFMFTSGAARLSTEADDVLGRLLPVLQSTDTPVRVEGYTDNVPLAGGVYASNWELSAARAASVVDHLARTGVDAGRLSATGFGERHPVGDNATSTGRQRNRRVVIALARHQEVADASVTIAAQAEVATEALPPLSLRRVSELPGPEHLSL